MIRLRPPTSSSRRRSGVSSIHGQCLIHLHSAISERLIPRARAESFDAETLANHIAEFSLAGLRAMAEI